MNINMNIELLVCLICQFLSAGICIGVYKATITFMKEQIIELKQDMKKYNNVLERMFKLEYSTKSAHKRIDELRQN